MSIFGNTKLRGSKEKDEDLEMKGGKNKKAFMENNDKSI